MLVRTEAMRKKAAASGGASWRLGAFGNRHSAATPFALNDTGLTKVREENVGGFLSVIVTRAENASTGAFDMGGTWNAAGTDDWSGGHSIEIFPASGETINWGTAQSFGVDATSSSETFLGVTGISGHEKVIALVQYTLSFGFRNDDLTGVLSVTLGGTALTTDVEFTYNANSDRFKTTQTAILYLDSPPDGDLVVSLGTKDWSGMAVTLLPVDSAASGGTAFGTVSTTAVLSNSTTLANSLTVVGPS